MKKTGFATLSFPILLVQLTDRVVQQLEIRLAPWRGRRHILAQVVPGPLRVELMSVVCGCARCDAGELARHFFSSRSHRSMSHRIWALIERSSSLALSRNSFMISGSI